MIVTLPEVTIGLPTYNRAELLTKCINSVLEQSYGDWEIIIADDNSSDATPQVARSLTELDSRISYFRQDTRVFQPRNRNSICSRARASLVFFIEDDLLLDVRCLANLVKTYHELAAAGKVGVVTPRMITVGDTKAAGDAAEVVSMSKLTGLICDNFHIKSSSRKKIIAGHACSLISKQAWEEVGGYEERLYKGTNFREETDFYFRLRRKGYEIYFEPEALVYHHKFGTGGSRSSKRYADFYYYLRNHIVFLLRFCKLRSVYMVPMFCLYLVRRVIELASRGKL